MSRYAAGQILFAVAITAVGAIKMFRLMVDQIDDATSNWTGLS